MSHCGQVVEFIEGGRVVTGVCLENKRGRIRALTENQKELQIAEARLLYREQTRVDASQPREILASKLRELGARREELGRQVDVKGLWDVLQGEGEEFSARELAELAFGRAVGQDEISAVTRAMLADRVYFRFRPEGFRLNSPETVEKILTQRVREKEKERLLEEGSRWIRSIWEGHPEQAPSSKEEIVELLKEQAILGSLAPRAARAEELLRRAGMSHPLAPFRVLVRLGVWAEEENLLAYRFGIRRSFPAEVETEAERLAGSLPRREDEPWREDLTRLETFSVDSLQTRDIDDALSVEALSGGCYRIGIHITDLAGRVGIASALDREAALRGTSIYLPEERLPMFPHPVSEEACSLVEGQVRPAVSLLLHVDGGGVVGSWRFCLSWIMVARRLTYEDVDGAVAEGDHLLRALYGIALRWRQERVEGGALLLPLPEVSVRVTQDRSIHLERRDKEGPAQVTVSEMMIRANWLAARCLKEAGVPCMYRVQPEPRERIVEGFLQGDLLRSYKQRKLLNRAETQLEPGPHSGLGLTPYTTVTSPIRRYADLVLQRQLTAIIKGESPPYDREEMERISAGCDELTAQANQMEQARQRYWLLRYLESRRGEETPALVLGRFGRKVQVLLTDYMLEASLASSSGGWLQEGEEVRVKIIRSRPLEEELKVELC